MGKIKVNENTVKEIDYIPCINCGSDSIDFGDCGYSSFNVAYGKCRNCKHTIEINPCSWNISTVEIVNVWNKSNDPKILREEYRKKIEELQKLIDGLPGEKQYESNITSFEQALNDFAEYCYNQELGIFIPSWLIDNYIKSRESILKLKA